MECQRCRLRVRALCHCASPCSAFQGVFYFLKARPNILEGLLDSGVLFRLRFSATYWLPLNMQKEFKLSRCINIHFLEVCHLGFKISDYCHRLFDGILLVSVLVKATSLFLSHYPSSILFLIAKVRFSLFCHDCSIGL